MLRVEHSSESADACNFADFTLTLQSNARSVHLPKTWHYYVYAAYELMFCIVSMQYHHLHDFYVFLNT